MGNDDSLEEVFNKYKDNEFESIPEPARTLVCIYSAHGIIGNGGFRFFFENNFNDNNEHAINYIISSYNNIGLIYHALAIKEVLGLFPDSKPHEDLNKRREFLAKYFDDESTSYLEEIDSAEEVFFSEYEKAFKYAVKYYESYNQ